MSKNIGMALGIAAAALGVISLVKWQEDLFVLIRGTLPVLLIACGTIAIIAGISQMCDEIASRKEKK